MDNIRNIINEGRPKESDGHFYEPYWYRVGVHDGFDYFEQNRLKACDNQTPQEAWREAEFVVPFVKEHHRQPTFSDAIEATRKQMIDKACDQLCKTCYVGERNKYKQCGPCQCEGGDFYNFRKAMEE